METSRRMAWEADREGKWTEIRNLKIVKKNNETSSQRTSKNKLILWKMSCFFKNQCKVHLVKLYSPTLLTRAHSSSATCSAPVYKYLQNSLLCKDNILLQLPVAKLFGVAEDNIVYLNV